MKWNDHCRELDRSLRVVLLTIGVFGFGMHYAHATPPSFQAAGTPVSWTGTGNTTVAWPAHIAGDIALLFVETTGGQAATLFTANGFAAVASSPQATGATTAGTRITVFWARATSAGMLNPVVTVATGNHAYARILTYRGVATTGNPWDVTGGGVKAAASTSVTVTGVTTTEQDTLIVQAVARDNDSAAAAITLRANSNDNLSGITVRSDAGTTSGNGGGFAVWDARYAVASATGNTTVDITSSINAFITIALRAATPSPTPPCTPPPNIPAGVSVTCVCDAFGRTSLNPSTIFGSNWSVSNSDGLGNPYINPGTGLLRLTEHTGNNAKAATVPSIFPAAGNYISVEFLHHAYYSWTPGSTGADGIAVTLSDYLVPAVPGAFGGSLGYAQRTGVVGFAGGWVGVALDEWGNYQNPTEGRDTTGFAPGFIAQSIGVRGPGSGNNGYRWMGGTGGNPGGLSIDNNVSVYPAPGYLYQIIVDARNTVGGFVNVSVNRDATTRDGTNFVSLFGPFNAYPEANHALSQGWISQIVPDYWKISFTGSTGGANNIHEIGGLRICAQTVLPPTGGTASGFSAIDDAYPGAPTVPAYPNFQTGDIFMKLIGTPFRLWVAALTGTGISTGYSATVAKYVQVKFVDNTDNACGTDAARTCVSACTSKSAVESVTQVATFSLGSTTGVANPLPTFTLNSAWKNLVAVMHECTTSACSAFTATAPACSADSFSVRPTGVTVVSSDATNTGTGGTPIFKAGADTFNLTATIAGVTGFPSRYNGVLKINSAAMLPLAPATVLGTLAPTTFPAAVSGTPNATATGNNFTYNEVGGFYFRGFNPASDTTTPRGIYDGVAAATECASPVTTAQCDTLRAATWTGVDSLSTEGNCVASSYSNAKDASGKYGCLFGLTANSSGIGRFTPAYFDVSVTPVCGPVGNLFTYSGQAFSNVAVVARAVGGSTTSNYRNFGGGVLLSKNVTISDANGGTGTFTNATLAASIFSAGIGNQTTVTYTLPNPAPPGLRKETIPATVKLRATDTDGVSSNHASATEETAEIRSGRVRVINAYGSELAALAVPLRAEYYSADGWVTNTADTCTSVPATSLSLSNTTLPSPVVPPTAKTVGTQTTSATVLNAPMSNGDAGLTLSAPGPGGEGYVDITPNLGTQTWMRYDWDGDNTEEDPTGRGTFGLFRGSPRHIYVRERY